MIINPRLPSGHVVFCDDIRQETNGKRIFVGVYNNVLGIAVPAPITLPLLCAAIVLRIEPPIEPVTTIIRITRTDTDEVMFEIETKITPMNPVEQNTIEKTIESDSITFINVEVNAQIQDVIISRDCEIKVRAYLGDDEIRIGTLQVRFSDIQLPTQ